MLLLFKTNYSIGKSLIQVNEFTTPENKGKSEVPNLVDLCVDRGIKQCFVVDDSLAGFWQCYKTLTSKGIELVFGLRLSFVSDASYKTDYGKQDNHKNIIFIRNEEGYKNLIRISTAANIDFFYKEPRIDYNYLHSIWSDDLVIAIPFYDSFLYKNLFTLNTCVPDYRGIKPVVFYEQHNKPHDPILLKSCINYAADNKLEMVETRSIYYEKKSDFLAWKARKVLANHRPGKENTIMNANLSHCSADTFCLDIN